MTDDRIEKAVRDAEKAVWDHEYTTGGGRTADFKNGPLVCSCGHREKPDPLSEGLQQVHLRHQLRILAEAGLLDPARQEGDHAV